MSKIRTVSLGFVLAAGPALAEDRPAVRLLPAQPMAALPTLTARGAADGFEPFPSARPRNDVDKYRGMFDASQGDKPASNWSKFTKWVNDRADAVKKSIDQPPADQPTPRVGQSPRRIFDVGQPKPPERKPVSAAEPAYRWYGWGTATPGANQYAPTGEYPNGSALWYSQTGATPGAFPVPTMNPYRPAPGEAPPTYTVPVIPPPASTPIVQGQPVMLPSAQRPVGPPRTTIAETPIMSPTIPQVAPAMPSVIGPSNQVPVPPSTQDWKGKPHTQLAEPTWRPAGPGEMPTTKPVEFQQSEPNGLIIPVIRGAAPSFDDSPLARKIHEACRGLVTNVTIRETGPSRLAIGFDATTGTLAEVATQATRNIIELKGYEVEFTPNLRK